MNRNADIYDHAVKTQELVEDAQDKVQAALATIDDFDKADLSDVGAHLIFVMSHSDLDAVETFLSLTHARLVSVASKHSPNNERWQFGDIQNLSDDEAWGDDE